VARILALWGAPRTVSTAFERMMRERGDHEVFFEPFAARYYFSAERRSPRYDGEVEPRPEHALDAILRRLVRRADARPTFIKDMAYHVVDRADDAFLAQFHHTFIVRHPRFAIPSFADIWPDFTEEEAGFVALRRLFDRVVEREGRTPPVIDGEDLLADPGRVVAAWCEAVGLTYDPRALTWEAGRAGDWQTWSEWTREVERSSGLPVEPSTPRDGDALRLADPRLEEAARACLPHYRHLARHRIGT
jgi:hypothetical protein